MLEERHLKLDWIIDAVERPDRKQPDPDDSTVTRLFKRIEDHGGRILRVAHRLDGADIQPVTAFFDRGARP